MNVNVYYLELMFILLNISQLQKLMKKVTLTETLFLRRKDKKHQKKKIGSQFIRINTSKESYDAEYEASTIQIFISKFKDRQLKILNKKLKELEGKIEKLTGQTTQ